MKETKKQILLKQFSKLNEGRIWGKRVKILKNESNNMLSVGGEGYIRLDNETTKIYKLRKEEALVYLI